MDRPQVLVTVASTLERFAANVTLGRSLSDAAVELSIVRTSVPTLSELFATHQTLDPLSIIQDGEPLIEIN